MDLAHCTAYLIQNNCVTILESIYLLIHLFKTCVVDMGQAKLRTCLTMRNNGDYNCIDGGKSTFLVHCKPKTHVVLPYT